MLYLKDYVQVFGNLPTLGKDMWKGDDFYDIFE